MTDMGIKITVSGKKALDMLYDERGIKKLVIVGRAMEWLAGQDKTLQSVILGQADPADTLAILELIRCRIESETASISPAAQIVDEAAAASKVRKRKPGQRSRSARA